MTNNKKMRGVASAGMLTLMMLATQVMAEGDATPHPVDTGGLKKLGDTWLDANPYGKGYAKHDLAVEIGKTAFSENCARCHGIEAISGGIAPDLRYLEPGPEGDDWFKYRVTNGAVRDGRVYMPKMADYLSQETLWAIRTWLETKHVEN